MTAAFRMLSAWLPFVLSPARLAEYRSAMLRPKIAARHVLLAQAVDTILTDWHGGPTWCSSLAICGGWPAMP